MLKEVRAGVVFDESRMSEIGQFLPFRENLEICRDRSFATQPTDKSLLGFVGY
jgi:hypothetical protein